VETLDRLVERVIEAGGHQSWRDVVTILATTALHISEVSGLRVGDIDLGRGMLHVFRQTYPGRGGLSPNRRRAVAVALSRSSTLSGRPWFASPRGIKVALGCCPARAVG
jgi:integrase